MRQRLILIVIALAFPAVAHADIARKCKDATYVFSQAAGCVKRPSAPKLSATETYVMALDAIESDPKKAFGLFDKACREKHGAACTQVGMMFDSGRGRVVAKDNRKALDQYARACELGDGRACQLRGNAATNANDYKLALEYFKRGCAKDDGIACAQQAWYVEKGFVDAPDPKAARVLYDKGLRLIDGKCPGNGMMCHVRGYLYERGIGVVADPQKAQASYRLACAESYGEACGALAFWLDKNGGHQAEITATYEKACELEVAGACSRAASRISNADPSSAKPLQLAERGCRLDTKECGMLAELHRLGRGTQRDQDKATEIYRTACEAGDQGWCASYGKRLHEGVGTKPDTARARKILDEACSANDSDACTSLAIYISNDKTTDARAFTLVTKACTLGASHGCYLQAWMIEKNRHGGTQDASGALPLYEKACGQGSEEACNAGGDLAKPTDAPKARSLYEKGCDDDTPSGDACVSLASLLLEGKDQKGAIRAAARGCAYGKQNACDWLPNATTEADGIAIATTQLEPGCKQGNDAICYALAMVVTRTGAAGDKQRGFAMFQASCKRKHIPSCEIEAQSHYYGIGTVEDKPKGEQLYRALCDGDAGSACLELARIAFAAKHANDTMRFSERACTLKSADGCSMLGFMYYTAQLGVRWDISQAAVYFTKACDGGSGIGCANQAELVRFGINGPADPKKAFELYTKSCTAGQQSGCAGAAVYTQDVSKARDLWKTACDADVAEACVELAASLEKTRSGSPSEIARMRLKALSITEKEAASNPAYMYWLGTYHEGGMATVKDPVKALAWFTKACEGFDPLGCLAAAKALAASTQPGEADRARVYFQRACAAGIDDGCKATGAPPPSKAAGPPAVQAKSKGCAVGGDTGLVLGLLVFRLRRRRRA
jgi:TPR repeat protein